MNSDLNLQPYGSGDAYRNGAEGVTHLSDYWQIITRRFWLVLAVFGVTTASAIWAVSRQQTYYQAVLSIQVNDPLERSRSLVSTSRITAMSMSVDPVQSEMEVLRSAYVAGGVVERLGLRLQPAGTTSGSSLYRAASLAPDFPEGLYDLIYDAAGVEVHLRNSAGISVASGRVGEEIVGEGIRFIPRPAPSEIRTYPLQVLSTQQVVPMVRGGLSSQSRLNTNIIDVQYVHGESEMAPAILNTAIAVLQDFGAERVRDMATREVGFIASRLDSARTQLEESMSSIRSFKESQAFTNLSLREQNLVNQGQDLVARMELLDRRRATFSETLRKLEAGGLGEEEIVVLTAEIASAQNLQLSDMLGRLATAQGRLRVVLTTEGKTADHPDARAAQSEIDRIERELGVAVLANLRVVEEELESASDRLDGVLAEQRLFPALENQLQTLEVQQMTDQDQYRYLLTQLQQARITEAAASAYVDVIDPAVGATPIQPRGRVNVLLGAFLGLILGVGAAFFLEYLDRTVRTSSEVETLLSVPVLGVIPRLRSVGEEEEESAGTPRRRGAPMIVALDPVDPAAEAYRNLRMNLMFMNTEEAPVHTIAISSPGPSEGKSTTALNLAIMLAQQGQKVLLVDADLRRPTLHRALDLIKEPGLTNLLVGEIDAREAIRPNVLPNLDFLPSGPFPPNPSELLSSRAMQRFLADVEGRYGHVILDTPPVLAVTDAALLGAHTDGVLLVLRSGATEQKAAERAVDQLRRVGIRLFGAVLNEVATTSSDESYYLQYYHTYRPRERRGRMGKIRTGMAKIRFW